MYPKSPIRAYEILAVALIAILAFIYRQFSAPPLLHESLLAETFDGDGHSMFLKKLLKHPFVTIDSDNGVNGSRAIKVEYHGYEKGSRRVVVTHPLGGKSIDGTLSYDVKFCTGFDFVKGGKLHGLAPVEPVTGGQPVSANKWSARISFRRNGGISSYTYHQDLPGPFGETTATDVFRFTPGNYYAVSMYVRVNAPLAHASNGLVQVFINGRRVVERDRIRFRSTGTADSLISKILFNTFHGGSTEDFAPKQSDGSYSVECAFFDNLTVHPFKFVKKAPGTDDL